MKNNKLEYNTGDVAEHGHVIGVVLGCNDHFMVYLSSDKKVRWEINEDNDVRNFPNCIAKFDELQSKLLHSVKVPRSRNGFKDSLGRALYASVVSDDDEFIDHAFNGVSERIDREVALHARTSYVVLSVVTTSIICAVVWLLVENGNLSILLPYFMAGCGGAVGSSISVLLRAPDIDVPEYSSPFEHAFHGALRVLLGFACGIATAILIKAELVLGIAKESVTSIVAFGLISGFSERYLPSILESVESKVSIDG